MEIKNLHAGHLEERVVATSRASKDLAREHIIFCLDLSRCFITLHQILGTA